MFYSVVVPVYNSEKYLRECVDSILDQTFDDFELILVDDGSTDSSAAICDDYASAHSNIKVIHKQNGGSNAARKAGVAEAAGKYVCFVDSDDYTDKDWLKKVYDVLSQCEYDICCYRYSKVSGDDIEAVPLGYRAGEYTKEQIVAEIFPSLVSDAYGNRFSPSMQLKVFRRELVVPVQLDLSDDVVIGEDACVCYSCIRNASSMYLLDELLYYYRKNEQSLTGQRNRAYSWEEPLLKASFLSKYLPEDIFAAQIARITVGSTVNVAASMFFDKKYNAAKKEIKRNLNRPEYKKYTDSARFKNKKLSIAAFCLRHKFVFILYLYAKLFK